MKNYKIYLYLQHNANNGTIFIKESGSVKNVESMFN